MATRNFVDKNGNSWEWDETPETIEALKQLHKTVKKVNLSNSNEQKSTDT
jgi:FMN phosphatase YigB (HAD superfamily)